MLTNKYAIESPIFKKKVIPFLDFFHKSPPTNEKAKIQDQYLEVCLPYYEVLSEFYRSECADHMDKVQWLVGAAGKKVCDSIFFRKCPGAFFVSVFLNQTDEKWDGYVVPLESSIAFNTWAGEAEVIQNAIAYESSFPEKRPSCVEQFCKFGFDAQKALDRGDSTNAFILTFIAIESNFSEKTNTTKSISSRTAALIAKRDSADFNTRRVEIEKLYSTRSKYVHEGKEPTMSNAIRILEIYQEILPKVLMRKSTPKDQTKADREWLSLLDWVASGYEAGRVPDVETAAKLNIVKGLKGSVLES